MKKLTPAHDAELKFLRREVDMWQDKVHQRGGTVLPNAPNNLWVAREELDRFVRNLRINDYHI